MKEVFDYYIGVNSAGYPYKFEVRPHYMFDSGQFKIYTRKDDWYKGEPLPLSDDHKPSGLYGVKDGKVEFVFQHGWAYGDSDNY